MTAPVAAAEQLDASPAEVVAAVRAYLDGGQVAGQTLSGVALELGVPVARLLAVMRAIFDLVGYDLPGHARRPPVTPERWR